MSYARFGPGSDVYVFTSSRYLECCGCGLQEREWVPEPGSLFGGYLKEVGEHVEQEFKSNQGMIEHLEQHVAAGHAVPERTFERLRDPQDAERNEEIWESYERTHGTADTDS